jgi:putative transposase
MAPPPCSRQLNVLDGSVISQCKPRYRHQEFIGFLYHRDQQVPADLAVHLIADNYLIQFSISLNTFVNLLMGQHTS